MVDVDDDVMHTSVRSRLVILAANFWSVSLKCKSGGASPLRAYRSAVGAVMKVSNAERKTS